MHPQRSCVRIIHRSLLTLLLASVMPSVFAGKPPPPPPPPPSQPPGVTTLISITPGGNPGNHQSATPSMSTDNRYVAFGSSASDLIANDTNGYPDIFVRDRTNNVTERVNVANDGTPANNNSWVGRLGRAISADGRYVVFSSYATNLVSGEQHYYSHLYVHDRVAHTTQRISVATDGTPANNYSYDPAISADGRYVTFSSHGTNLVTGDTNGVMDIFVRDLVAGTTERVSLVSGGAQANGESRGPDISSDGRYIAFLSDATNLVAGDTNATSDAFVYDRTTQTTSRVSVANNGSQGNNWSGVPAISGDGRYVAFTSTASNLVTGDTNGFVDVFVRDRTAGTTERVSVSSSGAQATDESYLSAISANGNFVTFISYASNLVPVDSNFAGDSFIRNRGTGVTELVSLSSTGVQGNYDSQYAVPSNDGRWVVFDSYADNFVSGPTNGWSNVYMRERTGTP